MFYHKVYMNQIHSSSLLCQLASMWKNQVLCDAVIKTGNTQTKAHRVVLVAACPMLHSMKNASVGSNLEVRLAADIKQESITTFLQYLYEGFMMLTEENCKDVEKIARVLQVDSVLKCCADFYKCLHSGDKYEYTFHDNVEFRHTRSSEMLRAQERSKRAADMQPASPGVKRQRIQSRGSTDMLYGESDPWDRVPRDGLLPHTGRTSQPGVIEIMEDSVEILHSDPPDDSGGTRRPNPVDRLGISVASNMKSSGEIQIVNMSGTTDSSSRLTASGDMSPRFSISHPNTSQGNSNFSQEKIQRQDSSNFPNPNTMTVTSRVSSAPSSLPRMASPSYNIQSRPPTISKPFAAGNASQASKSFNVSSPSEHSRSGHSEASRITSGASTLSFSSPNSSVGAPSPVSPSLTSQPQPVALWRSSSSEALGSAPPPPSQPPDKPTVQRSDSAPQADADTDLAIVKIESDTEFGNIEIPDDPRDDTDDQSAEWGQEEVSNEGSNEDKMPQWMTDSLKADIEIVGDGSSLQIPMQAPRSGLGRMSFLDPVNYVMIELGQPLPDGYIRLDEEEKVCVPHSWLNRTLNQCVGKPAFFTLKKLVNGFVNPWECKYGGTSAYKNTPLEPVFNALLLFGTKHLRLSWSGAKQAINEKIAWGRKCHRSQNSSSPYTQNK